jgi:hypothetical protein
VHHNGEARHSLFATEKATLKNYRSALREMAEIFATPLIIVLMFIVASSIQ